jgi:signal transduction histidine kinase/PAS domain-containing protein
MDTALAKLHDRLAALEQENATLRSRLESCERSHAVLQAEVARYRQPKQDGQEGAKEATTPELPSTCSSSLEQHLLETTAEVARVLLTLTPLSAAVNTALRMIGETLDTDRVNIVETVPLPSNSAFPNWRVLEYEWNSSGTVLQYADQEASQGSYEEVPEIFEQMHQGQTLGYLIEKMPEPFRSAQIAIGVKSTHLVPIFVEGQWWGVLGLDDCRGAKQRSEGELAILKVAADCIGSAIERDRTQQALLQDEQERKHSAAKHSQELERINSELQQTLDRLAESEKRYRTLFELSSEGIVRWEYEQPIPITLSVDEQLELCYESIRIAEVNNALAQMYEYQKAEDLIGLTPKEFHDRNSDVTQAAMRAWIENGYTCQSLETEEIDRYGRKRYFLNSAISTLENDCVISTWISQVDITELRETQQALLQAEQERSQELERINTELQQALERLVESEKRYRTLFELSNEGIYRFELDPPVSTALPIEEQVDLIYQNYRYAEINNTFTSMLGLRSASEAIGKSFADFFDDLESNREGVHAAVVNGYQIRNAEAEEMDANGQRRYILWNTVSEVHDGYVWGGWGMQTDITELRETQQALLEAEQKRSQELERINTELQQALNHLKESEEQFRTLFELSSEGFYYTEVNPPCPISLPIEEQCDLLYRNIRVVKANPAFAAMYGVENPNELVGLRNADVHIPDSEKNAAFIRGTIENGYQFRNLETEEVDTKGRLRYFLNSGVCTIKDGYVVGAWSTQVDITELRETQKALLQAEQSRVAELAKANEELQQRDRLLEATATAANILSTVTNFDEAVNTALQILGEAIDTDRIAVLENFDVPSERLPHWQVLYEWDAAHTPSQLSHPDATQGRYEDSEEWYKQLIQGQGGSYLLEEMPEGLRVDLEKVGVKATNAVPIFVEDQFWGVLGFDDCRQVKQRSSAELSVLKIAADSIGSAIQQQRTQQALLQTEQARVAELAKANEELQQRDRLLSVVAQVTKDLLEAEDVEVAIPAALQAVGRVAGMSRVQLLLECQEPITQKLQHFVAYEWAATGIMPQISHPDMAVFDNDNFKFMLQDLHVGRSTWHIVDDNFPNPARTTFESIGIKSCGTVPIFIEGRYMGGVGFDDCVTPRQWSQQEIDVLTTAAESIGAALHRKQLVDRLIEERIHAEQERTAELKKANEALARTSQRLAEQPDLSGFLGHIMLEAVAQMGADGGHLTTYDPQQEIISTAVLVEQGKVISSLGFPPDMPISEVGFIQLIRETRQLRYFDLETNFEQDAHLLWQDVGEHHKRHNHVVGIAIPLFIGDEFLGHFGLAFTNKKVIDEQNLELLQALANQAALAIQLTRLAEEAKRAAIALEQEQAAQERAAELVKANEALKQTVDVLATETNLNCFLGHVLQVIANQLDAPLTEYWYHPEPSNLAYVGLTYWQGQILNPEEQPGHVGLYGYPVPPEMVHQESLHHRRAHFITEDMATSAIHQQVAREYGLDAAAWYGTRGVSRLLNVPLVLGHRTIGALIVFLPQHRHFTEQQIELTYALAQQVTLAIQLTRLAEEAKQTAIFQERSYIATEVHDTLAQDFAGVLMQLQAFTALNPLDPNQAQIHFTRAQDLCKRGLVEARRSVWCLQQDSEQYSHLLGLVQRFIEPLSVSSPMPIHFESQGEPYPINPEFGRHLLRIVQESLANAIRHANANTIQVQLLYTPEQIAIEIQDDGCGFDSQNPPLSGFGLQGMQQRASLIGAQLTIMSQPGHGTAIMVSLPIA